MRSRGFAAVAALALALLLICTGQAMASPSTGSRPAGVPRWVPFTIDHPTPATTPLPPAFTAASTERGTVISPDQAGAIFSAVWNLRFDAFETNDRSLMAEFETGPALESDEVTCGCNTRSVRGPIYGESVIVPRQRTFPASFLVEVKTTLNDAPYVQYLIIARQSMATPWRVVADPGESVTRPLDSPKIGPDGFDIAAPTGAAATRLPGELASYWHTWTEDDRAPAYSDFAPGAWTTQAGETDARDPSGSWNAQNGLLGYYGFEGGGRDEVWSFGLANGGAITCGVVRTQTIWSVPEAGIAQDPAQNNWGPTVPPGNYRYEAETQIIQPCFIQRPGARIAVVSGQSDPDTEQGVDPLPLTPTPPSTPAPPISQA